MTGIKSFRQLRLLLLARVKDRQRSFLRRSVWMLGYILLVIAWILGWILFWAIAQLRRSPLPNFSWWR